MSLICLKESQPFLYLGDYDLASNPARLKNLGITHILNCTNEIPFYYHVNNMRLPLNDVPTQNIQQYFEPAFKFIDEARDSGGKILVHCMAGVSRSATITIGYLMHNGMELEQAISYVRTKRPIINPNHGFIEQLKKYSKDKKATNAAIKI